MAGVLVAYFSEAKFTVSAGGTTIKWPDASSEGGTISDAAINVLSLAFIDAAVTSADSVAALVLGAFMPQSNAAK